MSIAGVIAAVDLAAAASRNAPPSGPEVEAGVIASTNEFRRDNGLQPVEPNSLLTADARAFADYLARTGAFSHTADGRDPAKRAEAAGYRYCEIAENLAYEESSQGFGPNQLVHLFVSGWEGSPGHRRNMLNRAVVETGVGVARAPGAGEKYVAVQEFGRPESSRYSFRIDNRSDDTVAFEFEGERRRLPAHVTVVYSTCGAGELVFDRSGVTGRSRYAVEPGAMYVLSPAPAGVQIEVQHRPGPRGRMDQD